MNPGLTPAVLFYDFLQSLQVISRLDNYIQEVPALDHQEMAVLNKLLWLSSKHRVVILNILIFFLYFYRLANNHWTISYFIALL